MIYVLSHVSIQAVAITVRMALLPFVIIIHLLHACVLERLTAAHAVIVIMGVVNVFLIFNLTIPEIVLHASQGIKILETYVFQYKMTKHVQKQVIKQQQL
uniref:Transmembrane domain-containing protein n=1 Tax=Spironucleus salmonicida TaxID=348837 RepID=V6LPZ1_9EUKA|eukprot:EST46737.1 Transmembrane domain-containing protein [Spironucleus salmonicida]